MSSVQHYTKCNRCQKLRLGKQQTCQYCKGVITRNMQHTMHLDTDTVRVSKDNTDMSPLAYYTMHLCFWSVVGITLLAFFS